MPELGLDQAARDRYLGIVLEETLRVERLIGDLMDLARLEAGGTAFSFGVVRVSDLFDRVRGRHERMLVEKGVSLRIHIASGAETLEGDAVRLEQAVQNLAANALRHTQPGGRITVEATPADGDRIRLAVRDVGEGIRQEHLPFVFDRFYKADASRAAAAGSGLGLSIVKAIAQRHGGEVGARSVPHVETVFEMLLPRTQPQVAGALHGA
jgi:signal transduction histidine kinase